MALDQALARPPEAIVQRDPGLNARYLLDFRKAFQIVSPAVLKPRSTAAVALCLRVRAEEGVALVPQLVLSLERLVAVRSLDKLNRAATVEAGILLADLQRIVAEAGLLSPLSLGSEGSCQLGGRLSSNAGGLNVLRHGRARRMVLGLEVVLADGTLGVITAASLQLERQPSQVPTALLAVCDLDVLPELLEELQAATGEAEPSFEYISDHALRLLARTRGLKAPPQGAHLVLCEMATTIPGLHRRGQGRALGDPREPSRGREPFG